MKILVTSGTGTVGSRVARMARQIPGASVSVTSRKAQAGEKIGTGIQTTLFDWQSPELIKKALQGQDKLVLITPASPTEGADGVRLVELAKDSGLQHIVLMSIHSVERAPTIPHFQSKIEIQKALEKSGLKWTTIAPNNFYQNDYWYQKALLEHGVYPQPFGQKGLSRVDADDIATAIVHALEDESLRGEIYPLVGPQALTGFETARIFSQALGQDIQYASDNLDAWENEMLKMMPAWLVADWKQMYDFFQREGLRASASDLLKQSKILKKSPKSFESFVRETVQSWKS